MTLVTSDRRGGAAVLTYANPPVGTMTAAGGEELLQATLAALADDAVRCIILTGGMPGVFVRHYDVGEISASSEAMAKAPAPQDPTTPRSTRGFLSLLELVADAPKPVIAAINGLCMGGGFELCLACDIRIAGHDVSAIGLPETSVGLLPGGGGVSRLPRLIGEARALELILRGRVVAAQEALQLGLVHEIAEDPLVRALEIADEFAARPPEGLAYAKRLVRAALDGTLAESLAELRRAFVEVMQLPSTIAAMKANLARTRR